MIHRIAFDYLFISYDTLLRNPLLIQYLRRKKEFREFLKELVRESHPKEAKVRLKGNRKRIWPNSMIQDAFDSSKNLSPSSVFRAIFMRWLSAVDEKLAQNLFFSMKGIKTKIRNYALRDMPLYSKEIRPGKEYSSYSLASKYAPYYNYSLTQNMIFESSSVKEKALQGKLYRISYGNRNADPWQSVFIKGYHFTINLYGNQFPEKVVDYFIEEKKKKKNKKGEFLDVFLDERSIINFRGIPLLLHQIYIESLRVDDLVYNALPLLRARIRFRTPFALGTIQPHKVPLLFPEPSAFFANLLRQWNTWTEYTIYKIPPDLFEWVNENVVVTNYSLSTILEGKEGVMNKDKFVGAIGWCEFVVDCIEEGLTERALTYMRYLHQLLIFGTLMNVGISRTVGYGSYTIEDIDILKDIKVYDEQEETEEHEKEAQETTKEEQKELPSLPSHSMRNVLK